MLQLDNVLAFTVLGLAVGGIFALAALGLVLVYRVTGVLNLAHGAMGMVSTFVAWQFVWAWHFPLALGVPAALLFSLLLGLALEILVFRHLAGRPQLVKAVVTVGLLLLFQAFATLVWGNNNYHQAITFFDPRSAVLIAGVPVGYNQILVVVVALVMAGGLAALLRFTRFGVAMRAVSDDPVAASLWGVPVDLVGSVSWMLGSFTAAVAGILVTPFVQFDTVGLTILVLDALAAALIGGLVSLPLTVLGGFILGLVETYPQMFISSNGISRLVAVLVILLVLLVRAPKGLLASSQ